MSIINKICLYSYDIIREEFKSNSFKNLKSNKDNKIIFVDGEKMPIDKEIMDIMQSYELNKGGLNLLYGSYFLEGEKIFTPLIYQDLKLNVDGDAINFNISDEKNLNVGAISSLLESDEEKIELIIQQLIDNLDNPNIDKLLASLVNMQDVGIQRKNAIILAKLPNATAGLLEELKEISKKYDNNQKERNNKMNRYIKKAIEIIKSGEFDSQWYNLFENGEKEH